MLDEIDNLAWQYLTETWDGEIVMHFAKVTCVNGVKHGKYILTNDEGIIVSNHYYDNGEPDGECIDYYETGKMKTLYLYKKGKLIRKTTFHTNGVISGDITVDKYYRYSCDYDIIGLDRGMILADGIYKTWYDNGKLREYITYKNGIKYGKHMYYYDNGQLHHKEYYINGKICSFSKSYHKNGKLEHIRRYIGRHHELEKIWHENGQLALESNYRYGVYHGRHRVWDETGVLLSERYYKYGIEIK